MRHAIYPGTFDPITLGHLDIIQRSCRLSDRVTILLAVNSRKTPLLSLEERENVIRECVSHLPEVVVDRFEGLLVDYAQAHGASVMIRGLRAVSDYDYEAQLALLNRRMAPEIDTVFLLASEQHVFVNSSIVRELYLYGTEYQRFVPRPVIQVLEARRELGEKRK